MFLKEPTLCNARAGEEGLSNFRKGKYKSPIFRKQMSKSILLV